MIIGCADQVALFPLMKKGSAYVISSVKADLEMHQSNKIPSARKQIYIYIMYEVRERGPFHLPSDAWNELITVQSRTAADLSALCLCSRFVVVFVIVFVVVVLVVLVPVVGPSPKPSM